MRWPRTPPPIWAVLCAASFGMLVLAAAPSWAADPVPKPNPEDAALAEALFKEARALMRQKNYAAACPKFAESYHLDPAIGSGLNLAACYEAEGKIATAWAEYTDAASRALRAHDRERERFARKHAEALEPRLPKLVLLMPDPPVGITLSRDDATLSAASLGTLLPVDPGEHTITAAAPGYKSWSQGITAREGQLLQLEIPALEREQAPSPSVGPVHPEPAKPAGGDTVGRANPAPPEPGRPTGGARAEGGGSGRRTAGLVIGAMGLAGLAAGGVFVGLTAAKKSSADETCVGMQCDSAGWEEIETAKDFADMANIALGAGGALAIAGGILLLTSGDDTSAGSAGHQRAAGPSGRPGATAASARGSRSQRSIWVLPAVGSDGGGVVARLRF